MARETTDFHDYIVDDPDSPIGKSVVKGTRIAVDQVLATLAANPDVDDLVRDFAALTAEHVQAVLAFAQEQVAATPHPVSQQQFYREATRREDIRRILDALAK